MALADLTNRHAVLQALAEYNDLGRDTFLATYGFGKARSYYLQHAGRLYDSKAVVGAAHGYLRIPARGFFPTVPAPIFGPVQARPARGAGRKDPAQGSRIEPAQ